jgi:hypothetical protein
MSSLIAISGTSRGTLWSLLSPVALADTAPLTGAVARCPASFPPLSPLVLLPCRVDLMRLLAAIFAASGSPIPAGFVRTELGKSPGNGAPRRKEGSWSDVPIA